MVDADISRAVEILRSGGVVAYPTDTLYGLAVDPRNADAVRRLFALKGRPESSALTLIAADVAQAERVARLDDAARGLAERWWPGPLTIVAPAAGDLAADALAGGTTVGVRVPASDAARALARAFGGCLTATSANRSGEPAETTAAGVRRALPDVTFVLDAGDAPGGAPSTIVSCAGGTLTLVREGAIAWERVLESRQ